MAARVTMLLLGLAAVATAALTQDELEHLEEEFETESFYARSFRAPSGRAIAPNVCSGGSVALESDDDPAPCVLREGEKNPRALVMMSPRDNAGRCHVNFDSEAPGFIRGKMFRGALSASDSLVYTGAFGEKMTLTQDHVGEKFVLPTTYGSISYEGSTERGQLQRKMERDFGLFVVPVTNHCQKIIDAPAGTGGRLIFPGFDNRNYTADTMCQWWIRAPVGKKIVLQFNAFNVGTDVPNCEGSDYIGVDKAGDPSYQTSPVKFCGDDVPDDVTSDGNAINVLGYGRNGGKGFCCTYDVIDA